MYAIYKADSIFEKSVDALHCHQQAMDEKSCNDIN